MKSEKTRYSPLALAVSALFAAPLAFANGNGNNGNHGGVHDFKLSAAAHLSLDVSTTENHTKVVIDKKVNCEHAVVDGNAMSNAEGARRILHANRNAMAGSAL